VTGRGEIEAPPRTDHYPSRVESAPRVLPRRDPVVYGNARGSEWATPEELAFFAENGFLFKRGLFATAEIEPYVLELERLSANRATGPEYIREPDRGEVRSIFHVHRNNPLFRKLARDPRMAGVARGILGGDVYIHQSRVNLKPGFVGKEFYWHSDFETWHVEDGMPRMRAVSCSISLTENFPCNGPVMVIPGSHRHFVACVGETPPDHYKQSLRRQEYGVPDPEILARLAAEGGIESPTGPAGSALFFDCNLLHGSNSNITPFPRSNAFFVYNAVENRLAEPFGGIPPRPEFIAARDFIEPIPPMPE
jgi:ectoine hydroxylase